MSPTLVSPSNAEKLMEYVITFMLAIMLAGLYWIGGLYFAVCRSANEIIKGLSSIDQRLADMEDRISK